MIMRSALAFTLIILIALPLRAEDAAVLTPPSQDPKAVLAARIGGQIARCWNLGAFDPATPAVMVRIEVTMSHGGKPATMSLLDSAPGSGAQVTKSYEAARRAILRCGSMGFDLDPKDYDLWQELAITFDPNEMRIE
jgi:hypothetical protein